MRMFMSFGLLFLLAFGTAVAQPAEKAPASTAPRAKVSELMTKALNDYPGKEVLMITVLIRRARSTRFIATMPMRSYTCSKAPS